MYTARIVVLTIALGAGGVAAYLVSGSDNKPAPTAPAAQLQTVDVLVAKPDIGLGQTVTADDMPLHLRKARLTRVSIEANSGICRGMLRHRYNDTRGPGEAAQADDSP